MYRDYLNSGNNPAQIYAPDTRVGRQLLAGSGFFCEDSRPFCPLRGHSPNGGTLGKGALGFAMTL